MRSKLNISAFPDRLKAQRKKEGLTQEALHQKTNISIKTINTWETAAPKDGSGPKVSNIISLCEALNCDFEYLFGGIEDAKKPVSDIRKETGLSSEAATKLRSLSKHELSFIDDLLRCSDEFKNISDKYNDLQAAKRIKNNPIPGKCDIPTILNLASDVVDDMGGLDYIEFTLSKLFLRFAARELK